MAFLPHPKLFKVLTWALLVALQLLIICAAFAGGLLYHDWLTVDSVSSAFPLFSGKSATPDLQLLHHAQQLLRENAYDPLPADAQMEYGMIRGMLQTVNDPFTSFYEPPQASLQSNQLAGHYGGIGVRLDRDAQGNIYLYPLPDSPALKAGLQEGDRLLQVGEVRVDANTSLDQVEAAIRGKAEEKVTLIVARKSQGDAPLSFTVQRADVATPSVTWNLAPTDATVGVVQVSVMAEPTPREVQNAISDLQKRGAKGIVLDLRNNGGGLVDSGVNTARLFLKGGALIDEQYHNKPVTHYTVNQPGAFTDLPMVVLVNNGTASAAEMLAGALQAQKRAQLVGAHTFGKDSVQLVFNLEDGSSLHVTTARWWVPGLPAIKAAGLKPDISAEENGARPPLEVAIDTLWKR